MTTINTAPVGLSSSLRSSFFSLIFVLCALLAAPAMVRGQCEQFALQPAACIPYYYPNPMNASVMPVQNGAPANQSVVAAAIMSQIQQAVAFPVQCQEALAQLNCLANLATCGTSGPTFPCSNVCENVLAKCTAAFAYVGMSSLLPNCSVFPVSGYYPCIDVVPFSTWPAPPCPPGYTYNPYPEVPMLCLPECPLPYYSDDQWDALWYIYSLFGLLTVVVAIFVLPPYLLSPGKWRWPQQMNMWIMVCSAMVGLCNTAPLVFYGNNWRDVVCTNDVSASGQTDNALCTFQSVFQIYFGLAGILWWLFLVGKAALLVNGFRTHTLAEMLCAHAYCWGIPLISLTIILANGKAGSGSPPICNYLVTGPGEDGWYFQAAFLIPEAVCLLIGCCFMITLLYTLIKYEGLKGLRKQGRLLTYLICFLIPNFYLEIFYYVTKTHDSHEADIARWLACLATYYSTEACEDLHDVPNYPAQVVNVLLVCSMIFAYMLIFGLKVSVFQWWWALIKGIFTCDWKNFKHWWTDISTSQTSHSTSAASK